MQPFAGVIYESSEQHKEATPARLEKDFKDASKIIGYVVTRSPFCEEIESTFTLQKLLTRALM